MILSSYSKVLYLLAACQKYEMASVQSYIRAEVNYGVFPTPKGFEVFAAYAIASGKGLAPEMENTARQTLDHPMTFEVLGDGLRLFENWALRDLANLRRRYRDNLKSCFASFLKAEESKFEIWTPCIKYSPSPRKSRGFISKSNTTGSLPSWLAELYLKLLGESQEAFSRPLFNPRSIRGEYLSAVHAHIESYNCVSCFKVHTRKGETFCRDLEDRLTRALNEVCHCSIFWSCGSLSIHLTY